MNIEIANRLYLYRKKNNLSQEELAEKLGISRQAVSKWERAEASPDTDNLINLAKLYGVTLDELLNIDPQDEKNKKTEADPSAANPSAAPSTVNTDSAANENLKDTANITIGKDGILVQKKEKTVRLKLNGIDGIEGDLEDSDPDIVEPDKEYEISIGLKPKWTDVPVAILAVIAYLILGSVWGLWHPGWIIFLMIPVIIGVINAIANRRLKEIPYPIVAVVIYLLLGFLCKLWHPGWIIFLTIPVFYWLAD